MKKLSASEKERFKKQHAEAIGKRRGNNIKTYLEVLKNIKTKCPKCRREWDEFPCEQSIAIEKRGKCIQCIIDDKEPINIKPYEFQIKGDENGSN